MGIVSWARSRFSGKTESRGFNLAGQERRRVVVPEEDEPQPCPGFLSIGTLGSSDHPPPEQDDAEDLPELTMEEAKKLQEALTRLLRRARSKHSAGGSDTDCLSGLPLDRFLNCPSSLEVDRRVQRKESGEDGGDLSAKTKIIPTMAKDLLVSSGCGGAGIKNKSFKFLLKKIFVCGGGGGLVPAATLKDPLEKRMNKFFRTVLGKTINVRWSNGKLSRTCVLEECRGRHRGHKDGEEDAYRWDRSDSEFIVLEI